MTADDFNTPLGRQRSKPRRSFPVSTSQAIAGALALFLGVFVLWAVIGDNPYGGEPTAVVPTHPATAAKATVKTADGAAPAAKADGPGLVNRYDGPTATKPQDQGSGTPAVSAAPTKTVTIIDGKTGARQDVVIPAPAGDVAPAPNAGLDQKFVEATSHGPIPKISADGIRPADAFAQPVTPLPGKPDAPRVALVVLGLGVSATATSEALARLPGPVTLGFLPYSSDVAALAGRARALGHEVLLQVPMEPFDYPDNDPGPQTLLTSLAPQQNIDRLYWLMSRFQGYVGIASAMGSRFTASEQSFGPILREITNRGLVYVDDGANPRSIAGRVAGGGNLPFAKADVVLDSVPTPAEVDRALGRLEMAAREHGVAVGVASARPVSLDQIAKWAKAAAGRGLLLVPVTAIAVKPKAS